MTDATDTHAPFSSRADLHVHSRYSDRPSEWILRRVGSPESFVEPLAVYRRAKAMGLDYVTISDHNKIDGALEIAHLPDAFISCEVTTYFPENGAKMHVLVTGITEAQFKMIQDLRENIYLFRDYVMAEDIIHSVAHPLFLVNDRLTVQQFEKLLLLFNRFEVINGTRDPRASRLVSAILDMLTPEMMARLTNAYGIEPAAAQPHLKHRTGGSDDHSGLYVGSAHTVTPRAANVQQFLSHLRAGRHEPAGRSGNSVHLAHCFYHIAYAYYKDRILRGGDGRGSLLGEMLRRLLEPAQPKPRSTAARLRGAVGNWWFRRNRLNGTERMLVDEFTTLFGDANSALPLNSGGATQAFEASCKIAHELSFTFFRRFTERVAQGNLTESLETIAALGPVVASIAPYLAAFKTQHKDEGFIRRIARHFDATQHLEPRSGRRAWVTDTLDDVNGVAVTIHSLAAQAVAQGKSLTVLTSLPQRPQVSYDLENFAPVGQFKMPEYPSQQGSFPPFLQVIEHIERRQYDQLFISTPGTMGLTALLAAKLMKLRTVGIYHTDFPTYIRCLTDDEALESLTWRYMYWFYSQCDQILVPSDYYRRYLIEHGFDASRLAVLPRGVDLERFNPRHAQADFWPKQGGTAGRFTYLYVGRISDEKNVRLLLQAFDQVLQRGIDAQLAVVGDGPLLKTLRKEYKAQRDRVLFTGFLGGAELGAAYASSDVFVFPSTTDTFGNVVLEAQVSGLPAIVSDRGGPQEIVRGHQAGLAIDLSDVGQAPRAFADAMERLFRDDDLRQTLRTAAEASAGDSSWGSVLEQLWRGDTADQQVEISADLPEKLLQIGSV